MVESRVSRHPLNPLALSEFYRVYKQQHVSWKFDDEQVLVHAGRNMHLEYISFPEQAFDQEELDLSSFWVSSRWKVILDHLRKHDIELLWEVGAGSGAVAIPLQEQGITVIAAEPHYSGAKKLGARGILTLCSSVSKLQIPGNSLRAIGAFDVLEHIEYPRPFLNRILEALEPGGLFFVTVPAHQWLFSDFDTSIGHYRRYTRKSLRRELVEAGFIELESRHFFGLLVLPTLVIRRIPYLLGRRRTYDGANGIKSHQVRFMHPKKALDIVLKFLLWIDSKIRMPFGLSIVGVYRKTQDMGQQPS